MELGGNLLGGGDGANDTHGPVAAVADGDVDEEDASEERHPGESARGGGAQLGLEHRGDGAKLHRAMGHEEGELRGLGPLVGPGSDAGAQGMVGREHAVVEDGVGSGSGDQSAQPSDKGVGGHLGVGGPEAIGLLEMDADLAVRGALDGIEGERWPKHVAA